MNLLHLLRDRLRVKGALRRRPAHSTAKTGPAARSILNAQSNSLSSTAHAWVRQLPVGVRPLELCNVYPRIANRIALCWDDWASAEAAFNDLLVDHRGGRKGFPPPIASELLRLHAWHEKRMQDGAR